MSRRGSQTQLLMVDSALSTQIATRFHVVKVSDSNSYRRGEFKQVIQITAAVILLQTACGEGPCCAVFINQSVFDVNLIANQP